MKVVPSPKVLWAMMVPPGRYRLVVRVSDEHTGTVAERPRKVELIK